MTSLDQLKRQKKGNEKENFFFTTSPTTVTVEKGNFNSDLSNPQFSLIFFLFCLPLFFSETTPCEGALQWGKEGSKDALDFQIPKVTLMSSTVGTTKRNKEIFHF